MPVTVGCVLEAVFACASDKARHNSVRLRHTLSALRFSCRSDKPTPGEFVPSMLFRVNASVTVTSNAWKTSVLTADLAFARAECSRVWIGFAFAEPPSSVSDVLLDFRVTLGDDEMVVTVVVAVRGRSADVLEMPEAFDGGNLPVSSSFRMRDLRSSSSSQTVDGAVVESVDSVPSSREDLSSALDPSRGSGDGPWRTVLAPERLDRFECLYRASAMEDRKSA